MIKVGFEVLSVVVIRIKEIDYDVNIVLVDIGIYEQSVSCFDVGFCFNINVDKGVDVNEEGNVEVFGKENFEDVFFLVFFVFDESLYVNVDFSMEFGIEICLNGVEFKEENRCIDFFLDGSFVIEIIFNVVESKVVIKFMFSKGMFSNFSLVVVVFVVIIVIFVGNFFFFVGVIFFIIIFVLFLEEGGIVLRSIFISVQSLVIIQISGLVYVEVSISVFVERFFEDLQCKVSMIILLKKCGLVMWWSVGIYVFFVYCVFEFVVVGIILFEIYVDGNIFVFCWFFSGSEGFIVVGKSDGFGMEVFVGVFQIIFVSSSDEQDVVCSRLFFFGVGVGGIV